MRRAPLSPGRAAGTLTGGPCGERRSGGALASDAAREQDVLGHDGDALGVNRALVRVLEQADEVLQGTGAGAGEGAPARRGRECVRRAREEARLTASAASCSATSAKLAKRTSALNSCTISRHSIWKGSLRIRSSDEF